MNHLEIHAEIVLKFEEIEKKLAIIQTEISCLKDEFYKGEI